MRILLLQLKRIGDLVLTAPAVAALRSARPDAELVIVVPKGCGGIARSFSVPDGAPALDQVIEWSPCRPRTALWAASLPIGQWDLCIDFTGTDRSALFTTASRAGIRVGYAKFCAKRARAAAYNRLCDASVGELHTVAFHHALVACALGFSTETRPSIASFLSPSEGARACIDTLLTEKHVRPPFAIFHPGTAREEKMWTTAGWREIIAHAVEQGLTPVMTGTGTGIESSQVAELRQTVPGLIDLTAQISLEQLAALIGQAALVVGVDSMAMHLASMFRRPEIALFGPTNPFHWRPLHPQGLVVTANGIQPPETMRPKAARLEMKDISTAAVKDAMDRLRPPQGWTA